MNTRLFAVVAFCAAGSLSACDQSNTGSSPDLSTTADLAGNNPMPDMTTTPPDMTGPAVFNNCNAADFVDRTGITATRTVTFGTTGNTYSPKCITIAAGQSVMFSGNFGGHPLRPGVGANATAGSANNPITATGSGTTASFTFPTAGSYPYNCQFHDAGGMNGVVKVQ